MAAAERLQNIMAKVTCPICLELFRDPVAAECGHSFCRECIARHCQGDRDVACPLCNEKLQKGNLRPNWELRNIVELLRSQPVEEPRGGNMCERHQEPLKLYCTEHQTPICLVCRESQAHRGHTVVPVEEAVQEYWETMKKQLEGMESTYGRLHPLVSLDRKHLSPSAGEEAQGRLKGLTENLATLWKVDTEGPRQRFEAPASQPQPREPDGRGRGRGVATRSELRGCQGREPGSEPAAEKQEETGSHVVHVCEEAPTPKYGLDHTSLDPTVHSINSRRDFEKSEVDVKGQRSRCYSPTSPAPWQVSAGDQAGVSPAGQGAAQTESGGDTVSLAGRGRRGSEKQKAAAGVHTETSPAPLPLNSPTTEYQQADAPSRGDSPQIAAGALLGPAGSGQVGVSAVPVGRAARGYRGPGGKAPEKTKICVREVAEPPGSGARNTPQGPRDASAGGVAVQETRKRPKDGSSLTPAEGSGGSRTDGSSASSEEEGKGDPAGGQAQPAPLDPPKHQPLPPPTQLPVPPRKLIDPPQLLALLTHRTEQHRQSGAVGQGAGAWIGAFPAAPQPGRGTKSLGPPGCRTRLGSPLGAPTETGADGTMAAADSVKRIKEQATCPICLELFRDPVKCACEHSFCWECITKIFKGHQVASCPQCRRRLRERDLRPNRDLKNIAEILRSQAAGKPEEWNTCERHRQPLQLYCKEHQTPICLVCMQSQAHRGHTVVPKEEAVKEYREKMAEQLGIIESSCGKLHQFVSEVWKHLPENEQDEERQNLARVCEKLTDLKKRTGTPEERFVDKDSKPKESPSESDSSESDDSKETEQQGHSGTEPGSEPAAEKQKATGGLVGKEAPTRKNELSQGSLDELFHEISGAGGKSKPKVAVKEPRKRPKDGSSLTPAEGSGGSRTDASSASSEEEGAATGGRNEAAEEGQQRPAKKRKDNEN